MSLDGVLDTRNNIIMSATKKNEDGQGGHSYATLNTVYELKQWLADKPDWMPLYIPERHEWNGEEYDDYAGLPTGKELKVHVHVTRHNKVEIDSL